MQRKSSKLTISALSIAAMMGAGAPAYAGGGNMNPAGSDPQPDPHQSGQSSSGTGEASRASSADKPSEKMEKSGTKNDGEMMKMKEPSERKQQ